MKTGVLLALALALPALACPPAAAQRRASPVAQPGQVQPGQAQPGQAPQGQPAPTGGILAVVNGDVISQADVTNRGRLFALSTGLPVTPDTLNRLRPQILKQLVDERLRLQEIQRRKIAVPDRDIAGAIAEIEGRNNMPAGLLRAKLEADGVGYRTLIDQVRVQIGWSRVIRQELGSRSQISETEVDEQLRILKAQAGQVEYRVGEIFIPVDNPSKAAEAQRFADTVIGQLRAGAPFPVAAAQFSQSQTALQGGDLGWVRPNQLDPEVAAIVAQMPPGAISNPVPVAGGLDIVRLLGKRELGRDMATMLSARQVFLPFPGDLNPNALTDVQRRVLEQAANISRTTQGCDAMDAAAKANNSPRPADPGEVRLESIGSPQLRQLMATLPPGQASKPIISGEGVAVVMVCSREQKNVGEPTKEEVGNQLLGQRIELTSRQLQRDLRRRAVLDERA